jgi:serine protease Do
MRREVWTTLGMTGLVTTAVIGISGAKITFPTSGQAAEIWTTTKPVAAAPLTLPAGSENVLEKFNAAFVSLADQMSPTVVNIYTKTTLGPKPGSRRRLPPGFPGFPGGPDGGDARDGDFDLFFRGPFGGGGQPMPREALGSGFVLNEEGYIVTNAHVVRMAGKNADEIMVKFGGEDATKGHAAKVIGVDELTDVALLKLVEKKPGIKAAPLGDSEKARVGEMVVAIGNPYGHTNTLTQGVVSALGRSLEGVRTDFIQTSASINPGNSGGPLFNLKGEVIGINTAIDPRAQSIGFAIPINVAKDVITQLVEKGRVSHAWMGVEIQDVTEEIAGYLQLPEPEGVIIKGVMKGEPADIAGMKPYDVIRKVNGKEVRSSTELVKSLASIPVGKTAEIEVLRQNKMQSLRVKLAEQPQQSES